MKICICFVGVLFLLMQNAAAQLCQGSLGDPVVDITFGAGSSPGPPLGNTTNYTYFPGDCPQDGFYTIANSTNGCFGDTWYSLAHDHTGDPNGYMMVINASFNPGDFFVQTVQGLCPNTTYEFASWIFNLLRAGACNGVGIKPNITFNIETLSGTVLGSYKTGDIPFGADWTQYGFFFTTSTGTSSVVLRMTNNAPGGCGNDLLLDDITFRPCGPLVSASITGGPDSASVCAGDKSVFTLVANVSAGYADPVFQWQVSTDQGRSFSNISGANATTFVRAATSVPGNYLYRLAVAQRQNSNVASCSIFSNLLTINVNPYPIIGAASRGSCAGDTLFLTANSGATFLWTGPLGFSSTLPSPFIPAATLGASGTYFVSATSAHGCTSKDSTVVIITSRPTVVAGKGQEICQGTSVPLTSTVTGTVTGYQWAPAAGLSDPTIADPVASPAATTEYTIVVANLRCAATDSVLVVVDQLPTANAGPDKVIISGQSVTLEGSVGGTDVTYGWSPNTRITGATTLNPVVNPTASQTYALRVFSQKDCGTATDSVRVTVYQQLFIPNAFTPNGDGINDTWEIATLKAYPGADVRVYNRFGELVFDDHGSGHGWDGSFRGQLQPAGAYVYVIDLNNDSPIIKGVVFIIL